LALTARRLLAHGILAHKVRDLNPACTKRSTADCTVDRAMPRLAAISEYERCSANRSRAKFINFLIGILR